MRTDEVGIELIHGIKQVVNTNHEIVRLLRAGMQQEYRLPELQKRWGLGRARLIQLLQREAGYIALSGQKPTINVAHVLRIDRLLEETHGIAAPEAKP